MSIELDDITRMIFKKKLILYAVGNRDIGIVKGFLPLLKDENVSSQNSLNKETIMNALIISYGRIFSKNNLIGKVENIENELNASEMELHNVMISLRNKFYAHNDPISNKVVISYDKQNKEIKAVATLNGNMLYSLDYFKNNIDELLDKVEKYFLTQSSKLIEMLYSKENGPYSIGEHQDYTLSYNSENSEIFEIFFDGSDKK